MKIGKVSNYDINIIMSHNKGFIVHIGCGTFVAESIKVLLHDLGEYLEDPSKFMELYGETIQGSPPLGNSLMSGTVTGGIAINTLDGRDGL